MLRVEQVCALERKVIASDTCDVDKYLLGGELFALYSRSRWSDLRCLDFIRIDRAPDGSGFVEAKTRWHKSRHAKKARKRAMPLVAPIIGLHDAAWVDAWWDAGTRLGVDWGKEPFGPLVRAPSREGTLMCRRCSSTEASSILVTALDLDPNAGVSSHSLKAITLVWAGRRGFPEREALLLGHHTTGQNLHAVYARNF